MVERALLLVNVASGTGHPPALAARLLAVLDGALGAGRSEVARVSDHAEARRVARRFVEAAPGRCAVVVGGGNGTLRAAVEGIAEALERAGPEDRAVLAALRLGSGNLFARHFGVPADPEAALAGIAAHLRSGRLARCALVRCDVEEADGSRRTLHATSLVGFGAFGAVPADIARWRGALPRLRRLLARLLGLERLNALEYRLAFALRALRDALRPAGPALRISAGGRAAEARLAAGALVKFDLDALPVRTGLAAGEPAMALALLDRMPLGALLLALLRPRRLADRVRLAVLARGEPVRLERTGPGPAALFLDEDPEPFGSALTLRVAGALPVAPGPGYRWPALPEATP